MSIFGGLLDALTASKRGDMQGAEMVARRKADERRLAVTEAAEARRLAIQEQAAKREEMSLMARLQGEGFSRSAPKAENPIPIAQGEDADKAERIMPREDMLSKLEGMAETGGAPRGPRSVLDDLMPQPEVKQTLQAKLDQSRAPSMVEGLDYNPDASAQAVRDRRQNRMKQAEMEQQHGQNLERDAANNAAQPKNIDPNSPEGVAARMRFENHQHFLKLQQIKAAGAESRATARETAANKPLKVTMTAEVARARSQLKMAEQAALRADEYDPSFMGEVAGRIPVVGNAAMGKVDPKMQKSKQAAMQLIMSWIYATSGKAITDKERQMAMMTYIPDFGDTDATLAEKKLARAEILKALQEMAGGGQITPGSRPGEDTTTLPIITKAEAAQLKGLGYTDADIQAKYQVK